MRYVVSGASFALLLVAPACASETPAMDFASELPKPKSIQSPLVSATSLVKRIEILGKNCGKTRWGGKNSVVCSNYEQFQSTAERLYQSVDDDGGRCHREILRVNGIRNLTSIENTRAAWRAYDAACLGNLSSSGSTPNPFENLTSTVGLIVVDGFIQCAGFLSEDRVFYTASHCRESVEQAGNLVRQLSSGIDFEIRFDTNGYVERKDYYKNRKRLTSEDWAVYNVVADDSYKAMPVASGNANSYGSLGIVAGTSLTRIHSDARFTQSSAARVSMEGTCEYVLQSADCVQAYCQTIRGFSGAPVFQARKNSEQQSVELIGLLHGRVANRRQETCGLERTLNTRIIIQADQFLPKEPTNEGNSK